MPYRSPSPNKRGNGSVGKFRIDVNEVGNHHQESHHALSPQKSHKSIDPGVVLLPKTRAAGGIWLTQSDFPHAFQNVIIYHNLKKYSHCQLYQDIWSHASEPYISNEKEVYFKLELDDEAIAKMKQELIDIRNIGIFT